jgi:hypothetical protein
MQSIRGCLIGLLIVLFFFVLTSLKQLPLYNISLLSTPISTQIDIPSLFDNDTCYAPCWFGITPGVTTASELETMILYIDQILYFEASRTSQLNPQDGVVIDGGYDFIWGEGDGITSYIRIDNGIVSWIRLTIKNPLYLQNIINIWDEPSQIELGLSLYSVIMRVFYDTNNTIILLESDKDSCNIKSLTDTFEVKLVYYYDDNTLEHLIENQLGFSNQYIQLTDEIKFVWSNQNVEVSCEDAIRDIIED